MSNTENTRSLQKLQDIIRKEIAFHDLEYQDGERGFWMNQNHEKINKFIQCPLKSTFSVYNMFRPYMYKESTLTVKFKFQKKQSFQSYISPFYTNFCVC